MNSTAHKTIRRRAAQLQARAAGLAEDIESMQGTYQWIIDAYGTDDERLPALEADIEHFERLRALLRAELRLLRSALAA